MKQIKEWKKYTVLFIGALLALTLSTVKPFTAHSAMREVRTVNVNLENDLGIRNPVKPDGSSDIWKGDTVLFGHYNKEPIIFRVLDKNTTDFGETTMFLDCNNVLYMAAFNENASDPQNMWESSTLRNELNVKFLNESFSEAEQNAICKSYDPNHGNWQVDDYQVEYEKLSYTGDKIFVLDASDLAHNDYGYLLRNTVGRAKKNTEQYLKEYWLRSPHNPHDVNHPKQGSVNTVNTKGWLNSWNPSFINGVSPALNVELSSVFFVKESGISIYAFNETEMPNTYSSWQLTLYSNEIGFTAKWTNQNRVIDEEHGGNICLSLSNAMSDATQISAMLLDSDDTVLYYGKIANPTDSEANVRIPAGLTPEKNYKLKVFSENITRSTSYAGNIEEFNFTVQGIPKYTVKFDLNGHGATAIPDATVNLNSHLTNPAVPTDPAYDFGGWYKETACINVWDFTSDVVKEDITLYAKWTAKAVPPSNTYKISFNANGGMVSVEEMMTDIGGKLASFPADPTRSGYSFDGWYTATSGGEKVDVQTIFTENKTLYAHWNKISINEGGSGGGGSSGGGGGSGGGGSSGGGSLHRGFGESTNITSGSWKLDAKGWWYQYSNGSYPKNEWKLLPYGGATAWYVFDGAGYMLTGWFSSGGKWYYLSAANNANFGKMLTGWVELDGKWYYLSAENDANFGKMLTGWVELGGKWYYLEITGNEAHPQGALYVNEKTPDGYSVDTNGAWLLP